MQLLKRRLELEHGIEVAKVMVLSAICRDAPNRKITNVGDTTMSIKCKLTHGTEDDCSIARKSTE